MGKVNEDELLAIAKYHLSMVKQFDPYANFEGVDDRPGFIDFLKGDPAFRHVGFANDRYVIARIGGNLITSLHRKLGDMYQAMFGYLLQARYSIPEEDLHFSVDVEIGGRTQERSTDGLLRAKYFEGLSLPTLPKGWQDKSGIGFEMRSCYQIGDSKRIQADWDMALALEAKRIVPVMLICCTTSLKSPVIRLRKSWNIYEGEACFAFIRDLTSFDLLGFMKRNEKIIALPVDEVLASL
jgi:hypothetical protein